MSATTAITQACLGCGEKDAAKLILIEDYSQSPKCHACWIRFLVDRHMAEAERRLRGGGR